MSDRRAAARLLGGLGPIFPTELRGKVTRLDHLPRPERLGARFQDQRKRSMVLALRPIIRQILRGGQGITKLRFRISPQKEVNKVHYARGLQWNLA